MTDPSILLQPYRDRIDALDARIVDLLAERIAVIREVGDLKAAHDIPAILPDRVDAVRERAAMLAQARGIDPGMVRELYALLIAHCCALEDAAAKASRVA